LPGGIAAALCASLVGISTVFAKQHYVLDVLAGVFLAVTAYLLFLRTARREMIPEPDRRLAPAFAVLTAAIVGVGVGAFWLAYQW
jgi:membrane-associated phospholipid phosphatase